MKEIKWQTTRGLQLLTDFYELTMTNGYLKKGFDNTEVVFDVFFRKIPENGGYALCAGLEQIINYIETLKFKEEDIEYIKSLEIFDDTFLDYLKNYKFKGDIYAIPEGTPIFPKEPVITIKANIMEAQLIETTILLLFNHQTMIATKASRIVNAAGDNGTVLEFGARRAHGADGAVYGARASIIAGCKGSSNTVVGQLFDVPLSGTMAHSWVTLFDEEIDAFRAYADVYPDNLILLVDTYDTLKSGVPNAIKVFKEVKAKGQLIKFGIRLDSGDLAYLSRKARRMLDKAGFKDAIIIASSDLDEYLIRDLVLQGAKIDVYGVGTNLITSKQSPAFGGVYKLVAIEKNGELINKIKISDNTEKITLPGFKQVWRLVDNNTGKAKADLITFKDEIIDDTKSLEIFDSEARWKRQVLTDFTAIPLQVPIYKRGKLVYKLPSIKEIIEYSKEQMDLLYNETKRLVNPNIHYVDLSQKLIDERDRLIRKYSNISYKKND